MTSRSPRPSSPISRYSGRDRRLPPCHVSAHAIARYRERIADMPDEQAAERIQAALSSAGLPVSAELRDGQLRLEYCSGRGAQGVHIAVTWDTRGGNPSVVTVFGQHNRSFKVWKRLQKRAEHKTKHGRYPDVKWSEREQATLLALRAARYTIAECAQVMHRSHTTIERYAPRVRQDRARWSGWHVQRAQTLRFRGATHAEIGRRIGKSEQAVKLWFMRFRRRRLADPKARRAIRLLQIIPPGSVDKALQVIRREGLLWQER